MAPEDLIKEAIVAQKRAEAPYSNYPVGAAILTIDNLVILGCNIESKAYPTTLCAGGEEAPPEGLRGCPNGNASADEYAHNHCKHFLED